MQKKLIDLAKHDRIHSWFNLTYAAYLVLPRSILQSMPDKWQDKFVSCLEELDKHFGGANVPVKGTYYVTARNDLGKFIHDPLRDYQRGRRVVTKEELQSYNLK